MKRNPENLRQYLIALVQSSLAELEHAQRHLNALSAGVGLECLTCDRRERAEAFAAFEAELTREAFQEFVKQTAGAGVSS